MDYEYRGIAVHLVLKDGQWQDEEEEWGAYGATLEEAQEAFREMVDDNLDH